MPRIVVRQFLLATALVVLYFLVSQYHYMLAHPHFAERSGGLLSALVWGVPGTVLSAFPIAMGVALSLLPDGRGAFRAGFLLAGGMTAFLVVNDLAGRQVWHRIDAHLLGTDTIDSRPPRFDDTTSALGGALLHALGRVGPGDIQAWPPPAITDSSFVKNGAFRPITDGRVIVRSSAVSKYSEAMQLFVPLLLGGIIVGLGVWLRRVATFHSARDERVLRLVLGWSVTLIVVFGVAELGGGALYELSSPRASIGWMFLPFLFAAIPSLLGWRALYRRDGLGTA